MTLGLPLPPLKITPAKHDKLFHVTQETNIKPFSKAASTVSFLKAVGARCGSRISCAAVLVGQLMLQQPICHAGNWHATAQDQNVLRGKVPDPNHPKP